MKKRCHVILKSFALLLCIMCFSVTGKAESTKIPITEENFKDEAIRDDLLSTHDRNYDGFLSESELKKIQHIDVNFGNTEQSTGMNDLSGLEKLTYLKSVRLEWGTITDFSIFKRMKLRGITLQNCNVRNFHPSEYPKLKELHLFDTPCGKLGLSKNRKLEFLKISNCGVKTLDIRKCVGLKEIQCEGDILSVKASKLKKLRVLSINKSKLTNINLAKFPNLDTLYITGNPIKKISFPKRNKLKIMDVSNNQLIKLDVSMCKELRELGCKENRLTKLDTRKCKNLEILACEDNRLQNIRFYKKNLVGLGCSNNQLRELSLKSCGRLSALAASRNRLKKVDLSSCVSLSNLVVRNNPLTQIVFPKKALAWRQLEVQKIPTLKKLSVKVKSNANREFHVFCDKELQLEVKAPKTVKVYINRGAPEEIPDYYWEEGPTVEPMK